MMNESRDIGLEDHLKGMLKAVTPDPGFVQKLKNKLSSNSEIFLEQKPTTFFVIFTAFSLLFSVLILWFFKRHFSKPTF